MNLIICAGILRQSNSPRLTNILYSITNYTTPVFVLSFWTTGGPATYVTWTRNGDNISLSDSWYTISQAVQYRGRNDYSAGDYTNVLKVSGRLPGVYGVSVTNDRTRQPVTSSATLLGD